jgi:6-pyruvoyltetrahydropterin/6-carboxytetrahydropterin synthase
MFRLTRRYRFSASHRLHAAGLSGERNRELYGKCNNPYGHGHDYALEVSVSGPLDAETGCIADLDALDRLVSDRVLRPFDHRNLNLDIPEFAGLPPTTENLALVIERRLLAAWPANWPPLDRIQLQETRRNKFVAQAPRPAAPRLLSAQETVPYDKD